MRAFKLLAVPTLIALALTGMIAYFGMEVLAEARGEQECKAHRATIGRPVVGACPEWTDAGVIGGPVER